MKILKKNKTSGITLIALVVTIIVLLVLAGISINMLSSDNGIIKQAVSAKEQSEIAEEIEIIREASINAINKSKFGDLSLDNLQELLENEDAEVSTQGEYFNVKLNERNYIVNKDGDVRIKNDNQFYVTELYKQAQQFFGYEVINYKPQSDSLKDIKWQLFYAGKLDENDTEEHIYLISKEYVENTLLPTVIKNGEKVIKEITGENGEINYQEVKPIFVSDSNYKAYFSDYSKNNGILPYYSGSNSITDSRMKKLNNQYFKYLDENNINSTTPTIKSAAYMLDFITWSDFSGEYAEYAIGGPTIELLFKAYNKYKNQGNLYQTRVSNNNGYQISKDNGNNWADYYSQIIENDNNNIDSPYSVSSLTSQASRYWIASPSAHGTAYIVTVNSSGSVGGNSNAGLDGYGSKKDGFRPIICLNKNVVLEKTFDGTKEVFKIVEIN